MSGSSANTSGDNDRPSLEIITGFSKRRGFVFQASEVYGGLSGFWDYGPYGTELANRLKKVWWRRYVQMQKNIFGVDGAIIQNPKLWKASGHVDGFNDPLVDCKNCKSRHRADHLAGVDSTDLVELSKLLEGMACPNPKCGKKQLTEPRTYNMMMKTYIGPIEDEDSISYLRPETAGSIFTNYDLVRETTRAKVPFGIAQVGKAFRNEISPRDFIFRVRELEQMEMQYFIDPDTKQQEYERWREFNRSFLLDDIGLKESSIRWHEHGPDERAHYAEAAHDIQFNYSFGFKELMGTHNRGDFDLGNIIKHSGKNLEYFDPFTSKKYVPNVIESSIGLGRLFLAVLTDAYTEEAVGDDTRVVLKIDPKLAPVDVAVLPLSKKPELQELAGSIFGTLSAAGLNVEYDETQSIGKRYRRQDEIGTPKCVTIDFDSKENKTVTVRDRDTMEQETVSIKDLLETIRR